MVIYVTGPIKWIYWAGHTLAVINIRNATFRMEHFLAMFGSRLKLGQVNVHSYQSQISHMVQLNLNFNKASV